MSPSFSGCGQSKYQWGSFSGGLWESTQHLSRTTQFARAENCNNDFKIDREFVWVFFFSSIIDFIAAAVISGFLSPRFVFNLWCSLSGHLLFVFRWKNTLQAACIRGTNGKALSTLSNVQTKTWPWTDGCYYIVSSAMKRAWCFVQWIAGSLNLITDAFDTTCYISLLCTERENVFYGPW